MFCRKCSLASIDAAREGPRAVTVCSHVLSFTGKISFIIRGFQPLRAQLRMILTPGSVCGTAVAP